MLQDVQSCAAVNTDGGDEALLEPRPRTQRLVLSSILRRPLGSCQKFLRPRGNFRRPTDFSHIGKSFRHELGRSGNLLFGWSTQGFVVRPTLKTNMTDSGLEELEFYVQELTGSQSRLRGYILASLGNYSNTADVLQRTNLTLWKKAREFRPGAEFLPWALSIARFEILAFLRDHRRDRHVFSDEVAKLMLDAAASEIAIPGDRQTALRKCLEKLPVRSRDLLWQRYDQNKSIRQIAVDTERSEDSVKCLFLRLRKKLERCIETTINLDAI